MINFLLNSKINKWIVEKYIYFLDLLEKKINELKKYKNIQKDIENDFDSLAPKDCLKNNYTVELLKKVIKDPKNRNIALSGKYGAGKSSVVKSAFKSEKKIKPLYISLGLLGMKEHQIKKDDEDTINRFTQSIEKSIIQQIIYKEKTNKLPASKIKRIPSANFILTFFIAMGLAVYKIPFVRDLFKQFYLNTNNWKNNVWDYICYNNKLNNLQIFFEKLEPFQNLLQIVLFFICIFIISKLSVNWLRKFEIKNLKLLFKGEGEIEIGDSQESLINKYMDELVYFFEVTKYNVLVIEDLDRFLDNKKLKPKVTIIFQKLKELNQILNETKNIKKKRKITFLYVVKDNLFNNEEERTKFFDFIVPIIPFFSNYNSYAELRKSFSPEISDAFLQDISTHIKDYRVIRNLKNEFKIYNHELNDGIEKENILAMLVLKNLKPSEYEDLINDKGKIYNFFENKLEKYDNKTSNIKDEIKDKKQELNQLLNEKVKNIKELKMLAIGSGISIGNRYSYANDKSITIEEFLSDDFEIDTIENTKFSIKSSEFFYGAYLHDADMFKLFGGKIEFLHRARIIDDTIEASILKVKKEIAELDEELKKIYNYTVSELLKEYEDIKDDNLDSFMFMMIKNGYIKENYKDYCFKFEDSYKNERLDYKYILNVRNDKETKIEYKLINAKKVIEQLDNKYFKRKCILNFDILCELLKNEELVEKKDLFLDNFLELDDKIYSFIYVFIQQNKKFVKQFIQSVYNKDKNILINILKKGITNADNIDELVENILNIKAIAYDKDIKDILNEFLYNRLKENVFFKFNNNIKDVWLNSLKLKVNCLPDKIEEDFWKFIYGHNMYEINEKMLKYIFIKIGYKSTNYESESLTKILHDDRLKLLKKYILENKEKYIEECFKNTNGISNDINDIVKVLNTWELNVNDYEIIVSKIPNIIYDIRVIERIEIYDLLLKYNKIKIDWKNIYCIYKSKENTFSKELLISIEANIKNLNVLYAEDLNEYDDKEIILKFMANLIIQSEIDIESFIEIIPKIHVKVGKYYINLLSEEKINELIKYDKIFIDKETYEFLYEKNDINFIKYVINNIQKFIELIDELEYTDVIITKIILSSQVNYNIKIRLLEKIDVDDLSNESIKYIIKNYEHNKINRLPEEIKIFILQSNLNDEYKFEFLNKENEFGLLDENLDKYMALLPERYKSIGKYEIKPKISLDKSYNIEKFLSSQKEKLNISLEVRKKTLVVTNRKNKK